IIYRNFLLDALFVLGTVKLTLLLFRSNTELSDGIGYLEQHKRHDKRENGGANQPDYVCTQPTHLPKQEAIRHYHTRNRMNSKNASQQHAYHAAYPETGKDIQGIIHTGTGTPINHQSADNRRYHADNQRMRYGYKSRGRRNRYQTDYHADTHTHCGWFFATG